ncbi:MAG: hypothetical protein AAGA99_13625 [Actinomycetota bacterium]
MAAVDIASFVADLKDHVVDHGLHVHDERHFIESYSLRQTWEIDLHPDGACEGPLDLHVALEVDPRVLLSFEDALLELPDREVPEQQFLLPLIFTWLLPPLAQAPDFLVLATDLAGIGGMDLPIEVSAIDSIPSVTDESQRSLSLTARYEVSLNRILLAEEHLCDVLDRCHAVCAYLLDRAPVWLGEL